MVSPPANAQAGELGGAHAGIFPRCLNLGKGTPLHRTDPRIAVSSQPRILPKHPIVPMGYSVGIHLVHRSRRHNARLGLATNPNGCTPTGPVKPLKGWAGSSLHLLGAWATGPVRAYERWGRISPAHFNSARLMGRLYLIQAKTCWMGVPVGQVPPGPGEAWTRVCFQNEWRRRWLREIEAVEHIVGLLVPFSQRCQVEALLDKREQ